MVHLEKEDFNELIKKGLHLVDFYAEWCGPCKMMMPVLESIEDRINIIKVNVDEHEDLAKEYRIMSIPTLIFFKDGELQEELVGFRSKEELEEIIDKY
jgi:thioredoxin 1